VENTPLRKTGFDMPLYQGKAFGRNSGLSHLGNYSVPMKLKISKREKGGCPDTVNRTTWLTNGSNLREKGENTLIPEGLLSFSLRGRNLDK